MAGWSQRRRSGGGVQHLNVITAADIDDVDSIELTYSDPVDASAFDPADFEVAAAGAAGDDLQQLSANHVLLHLDANVSSTQTLAYTGNVTGVQTPQSIVIT